LQNVINIIIYFIIAIIIMIFFMPAIVSYKYLS